MIWLNIFSLSAMILKLIVSYSIEMRCFRATSCMRVVKKLRWLKKPGIQNLRTVKESFEASSSSWRMYAIRSFRFSMNFWMFLWHG